MKKRQTMKAAAERLAYEEGYRYCFGLMYDYCREMWLKNQQYRAEIRRLKEVIEERVYG